MKVPFLDFKESRLELGSIHGDANGFVDIHSLPKPATFGPFGFDLRNVKREKSHADMSVTRRGVGRNRTRLIIRFGLPTYSRHFFV
jgi:hypothetical protein